MSKVLCWEKPKKIRSSKQHAEMYSADGAPPGVYVPNMSDEDKEKWLAKVAYGKTDYPQVEIRKGGGFVIIVSLNGYKYKQYDTRQSSQNIENWKKWNCDVDNNPVIHIASAGPTQLTMQEFDEFKLAIHEAIEFLKELKNDVR